MGWQSVVISSRWALRWGIKYVWLFYCGALRYWLFNTCDRPCFHVAARHNLTKPIFTSWSKIQFWLYMYWFVGLPAPSFLELIDPWLYWFCRVSNIRPDQPGIQGLEWPPLSWASFLMLLASAGKYCWILSKSIELISRRFLEHIDTFILWLPILTVTEMLWFPADMVLVSFWLW